MDAETFDSDMEFEIKDEVKEEIIDEILKEAQEALENANSELKEEEIMGTEDLSRSPSPPTFVEELNAVEAGFDAIPEKGSRNSNSKSKSFSTSKALKEHTLNLHSDIHNKRVKFSCFTCDGRNFIDQKSLDQHVKQNHINKVSVLLSRYRSQLECPHCPRLFLVQKDLNAHVESKHTHPLEIDPLSTTTPSVGTETKLETSTTRHKHKCPHCPYTFLLSQSLQDHIIKLHVKHKAFPCHICAKLKKSKVESFIDQQSLEQHINRSHSHVLVEETAESRLKCTQCDKTYSRKGHLTYHIKYTHSGPVPRPRVQCDQCLLSFSRNSTLRMHRITCLKKHYKSVGVETEPGPESLAKCPHCDKKYFTKWRLRNHILVNHFKVPEQLLKFYIRDKKYTLDNVLKEPLPETEKDQDTVKTLKTKKDLGTGKTQKTKRNAQKIKCRYCNKAFLNARKLRNHIIEIHVKQKKTAEKEEPSCRVQCPTCPSTFSNSKHLQFHIMLVHFGKEEFPCLICTSRDQGSGNLEAGTKMKSLNFIFKDEISLNQHMKNIHYSTHMQDKNLPEPEKVKILIPKNKICPICSKSFDGKWAASNYRGHMQTHLGVKRHSCEHCSKKFSSKLSFHAHLIRYHNYTSDQLNFKFACKICKFITMTQSVLNYHMGRKHPYDQLKLGDQLNVDPETETKPNQIHGSSQNKSSTKNSTQSAVCFVCSKIQTSKRNLDQHLKEHRGEGRFYCDLCPRDYCMRMPLLTHLRMDHHKLAYCSKCFTSFADAAAFNKHTLQVAGTAPALNSDASKKVISPAVSNLKCEICSKSFKSPCLFKIHTISHLKEIQQQESNFPDDEVVSARNIFKCSVCPSTFDRQSYLNAHLETVHESPVCSSRFMCDKCEKNYKFASELKYHDLVVHSPKINQHINQNQSDFVDGALGFKCDVCTAKFGTESELTDHQDKFRSEFLCHICPAKFKYNTALAIHLKMVHKTGNCSRKYLCHICPFSFFKGPDLRKHVERVHEGKFKKRSNYYRAKKTVENESETMRECNSNNKVSADLLDMNPETEQNLTPNHGSSKNKTKVTAKSVVCFVCSKMQSNKGNLMIHLKEHRGERRAYCDLCPRDYLDRFYLMAHLKLDHHKLANCNKCFTSFADIESLNQHLLHVDASENADSPASNLKCEICGESCKSPCLFKIHSISHLKEIQQQELNFPDDEIVSVDNIFKCSVCPSAFDRQSYLDAHLNILHESSPDSNLFECGKCERTYKSQIELKTHDLVVHSPKINQHNRNQDQSHASQVSGAALAFECSTCSIKFLTWSELTNHQDIFEPKVSCHICSAKFNCKYSLKSHLRGVHGSKNFVCDICLGKFARGSDMRRHVEQVHEGKKKKIR